ncbi:substrate-binding periplasmic protein [Vogesella fluminis]|nr:transporter substrate-binding domain-containing protein [Vogesella fluminis]
MKQTLMAASWLLAASLASATPGKLLILLDNSTEMPLASLQGSTLLAGIHLEVGRALASEFGKQASFLVLPRKRISDSLQNGDADLLCLYRPEWLPGPFQWSRPFLPNAELLITRRDQPRPGSITSLAGQGIGTIHGFRYPELETGLGKNLIRDDAPNASSNLKKLEAGRTHHAAINQLYLHYQQKLGQLPVALHPPLVLNNYQTGCALSRRSQISLPQLNHAITHLVNNKTIARILEKYR